MTLSPCRITYLLACACFLSGVGLELLFGVRGFMPLDHSIVFDGGWRILNGQIPWREFDLPSAATPSFIQAWFFQLCGVNWAAYIAHAALFNGLFCILVFGFLARLGLDKRWAALYGACSGALLFAPVGVPFPEQHALFFTLLGVWLFQVGRTATSGRRALIALALVPTALLLGFFSKQLPTGLSPLLLVTLLALPGARPRVEALVGMGIGAVLCAGLAGVFLFTTGVEIAGIQHALFDLPMAAADRRMAFLPSTSKMPWHVIQVGLTQGLWSVAALHVIFLTYGGNALFRRRGNWQVVGGLLLLAELVLLIDVVTIVLANNQDGVGVGWIFLALAIGQTGVHQMSESGLRWDRVGSAGSVVILIVLVRDVIHFSATVNATRIANDMVFDAGLADATTLPDSLWPMRWTTPEHHNFPSEDLVAILEYLESAEGDFLLVGDTSILYGLSGHRSVLPSLWYHPGVTLPAPGSLEFSEWQDRILENMKPQLAGDGGQPRAEVLRVVEERAGTWVGNWSVKDLPLVWRSIRGRVQDEVNLGAFRILELRPQALGTK
jgi:hypothetical protein